MKVSVGFSQLQDHIQAVNEAAGQAVVGLGIANANMAFVFTSVEFAHILVLKTLNNLLGEIPILGASSSTIITNKGMFKHGIVLLLISFNPQTFFNVASVKDITEKTSHLSGKNLGDKLLYGFKDVHRSLSIIFSDKLITEGTNLINGIQESLGKSFPLIGASAADSFASKKTFQYFNTEMLSESCCGILFGGKFSFGFGIKHGWEALGKPRYITKSSKNIIEEIDDLPAVKLYEDYFAKDTLELAKELRHISALYPMGIYLQGEKEYLLRNIVSIRDDGSVITQGNVPEKSKIRLMISTEESRLAATDQACQEVKRNIEAQKIKFVMVFDSAARFSFLSRQSQNELSIIKRAFGDTPIIGMHTNGEQAPLVSINYLGRTYFHNQSINILAIGDQ